MAGAIERLNEFLNEVIFRSATRISRLFGSVLRFAITASNRLFRLLQNVW
jgi:hypothetical protein